MAVIMIFSFPGNSLAQQKKPLPDEMNQAIVQQEYKNMHSILVSRNGTIEYEQYFNGYHADSLHDSRSSFKSVASLLVGIAVDKGFIRDIDTPVYTFFPEDTAFSSDPRKRKITIRHLLEMRAGFDCDEWTDRGRDCESMMDKTADWVQYALEKLPMKDDPGKIWAYTSCDPMILSGVLKKASGMSVMDFAAKYLFAPLNITRYRWTLDPAGNAMTGGSFYLLPGDMLKIGQLVLNNGMWKGKRIVSEQWLKLSTTATIPIPGSSFMAVSRSAVGIPQPTTYGFYWYNELVKTKDFRYKTIFASGNGGQYIIILKELDLVVVFTQGNYGNRMAKQAFDMLVKYILPAYR
ncbi:serine hydrolase domain-containing protein [Chitinophaga barathri]|nr:serine hydrolase [Chitinophaga barathri]